MPGYIVALNEDQLHYLISLVEFDIDEIIEMAGVVPASIYGMRDYLQSIYNTGGNATYVRSYPGEEVYPYAE